MQIGASKAHNICNKNSKHTFQLAGDLVSEIKVLEHTKNLQTASY